MDHDPAECWSCLEGRVCPSHHLSPRDPHDSNLLSYRLTALTLMLSLIPSFAICTLRTTSEAAPKTGSGFLNVCVSGLPPRQITVCSQTRDLPRLFLVPSAHHKLSKKKRKSQAAGPTCVRSPDFQSDACPPPQRGFLGQEAILKSSNLPASPLPPANVSRGEGKEVERKEV